MTYTAEEKTQRVYARITGLMFYLVFAAFVAGFFVIPGNIFVSGDFSATAQNMVESEQTYRLALASRLLGTLLVILLAGALYALLAPVDRTLALFALLFKSGEAILGGVEVVKDFIALGVYTGAADAFGAGEQEDLVRILFAGDAFFYTTVIFFSFGSTLFWYLMLRSRYIPRFFSLFGVAGSILVMLFGFAGLIGLKLPPQAEYVWIWSLLAVAELGGGLWLLIAGANLKHWKSKMGTASAAGAARP